LDLRLETILLKPFWVIRISKARPFCGPALSRDPWHCSFWVPGVGSWEPWRPALITVQSRSTLPTPKHTRRE